MLGVVDSVGLESVIRPQPLSKGEGCIDFDDRHTRKAVRDAVVPDNPNDAHQVLDLRPMDTIYFISRSAG